jgi:hypothetical protein
MTTTSIPFAGSQLDESRHVCAFFHTEDEQYRVLLPFIKEGFERGDKAVHVIRPDQHHDHLGRLTGAGIDPATTQLRGQLELRTTTETYLRDGRFDPDQMLVLFEELAGGAPLSRIVCQMDWAADDRAAVARVVEFEARVNAIWCKHDDMVICVYPLAGFGGEAIMDIMRTHPMVIVGGILHKNPFYVRPEVFLPELRERRGR